VAGSEMCAKFQHICCVSTSRLGAHGSIVGWGTILQARKSCHLFPLRLLDFSFDVILPFALWPWGRLSLWQKWVSGIFFRVEGWLVHKTNSLTAICEPIV
jgi:hypothetical protein